MTATATRLWALDAPRFTVDSSLLLVGTLGPIEIRISAYLIQHPKGLVLFDTQCMPKAIDEGPQAAYGGLAEVINMVATPEMRLDRQVEALGFDITDVTHVVASHLHFDHAGGLHLFPHARFYAGQGEMRHAYWPEPAGAAFFVLEDILPTRGFDWTEIPNSVDHDLFGDGSVTLMSTPGHTPGELSALVRLPNRNIVLTGDTAHLAGGVEGLVPMPFSYDTSQAVLSLRKLRLVAEENDAFVWVCHDPTHWAEMQAPGSYD
jgi:glyoxylase-like metal-dependent hydrolase (beta-lactamase superfamily II)